MAEDQDAVVRTPERNGDVVRRAVEEIWNQGDLAVADELFSAGYVNHGGLIPDVVPGPESIKVGVALQRTAFPDLRVTVEHLMAEGEMVAIRWVARSRRRGGTITPSSDVDDGALGGMTFCRFSAGKVAETWTNWDAGDILRKLIAATGRSTDSGVALWSGLN